MSQQERRFAVRTPDGRRLDVVVAGPPEGMPLVYHNGTPGATVLFPPMVGAAADAGLCTVGYARPGYRESTPVPGRSVAGAAGDVVAILDALGKQEFVTIGWSGGGPHALACAALLGDRCLAAASIAGLAPYADDLVWLDGMGADNVAEINAAFEGDDALTQWLTEHAREFTNVQGAEMLQALGELPSAVDRAALTGEFAEFMAASFRDSLEYGIQGWRDDDLAFIKPWGFNVDEITRPVAVWQGGLDQFVPYAHGRWLVAHMPSAHSHLHPLEGHLSVAVGAMSTIVGNLVHMAGGPAIPGAHQPARSVDRGPLS